MKPFLTWKSPCIRISSWYAGWADAALREVEIFNTGKHQRMKRFRTVLSSLSILLSPMGQILGLPMAQLAARRNFAQIAFEPLEPPPRCIIWLPITTAPKVHAGQDTTGKIALSFHPNSNTAPMCNIFIGTAEVNPSEVFCVGVSQLANVVVHGTHTSVLTPSPNRSDV